MMTHSTAPLPWQKITTLVLSLAAMAAALCAPLAADAAEAGKASGNEAAQRSKVVFQVSDADAKRWHLALNNINNVQEALGRGQVDIELVAYGPGIGMLRMESEVGNRVADAAAKGVKIVACETTMQMMKLAKKDMLDSIGYVPSGVVELMKRQSEGYAYIRP